MYINSFQTKNNETVHLSKINVFVGANNAGKSRTLQDIRSYFKTPEDRGKLKIVASVDFDFPSCQTGEELIKFYASSKGSIANHIQLIGPDDTLINGSQQNIHQPNLTPLTPDNIKNNANVENNFFGQFGKFVMAYLGPENRLSIINQSPSLDKDNENSTAQNFLQLLQVSSKETDEIKTAINSAFKECFGVGVSIDQTMGAQVAFRILKEIDLPALDAIPYSKQEEILKKQEKIDVQGHGFKSFLSTVLTLLCTKKRLILLDEPESHLHPPQAYFLGRWIAQNIQKIDSQLLITTHNASFLSGLVSIADVNINVFRVSRNNSGNKYSSIDNEAIRKVSTNPLLSNQRIIDGLFYSSVIVCEADTDVLMYKAFCDVYFPEISDTLFTYAQNKQTITRALEFFRQADVPVVGIVDIDVLNTESKSTPPLLLMLDQKSTKTEEQTILNGMEEITKFIEGSDKSGIEHQESRNKEILREKLQSILNDFDTKDLSVIRQDLESCFDDPKKWKPIKNEGIYLNSLTETIKTRLNEIINIAAIHGAFIVPCGELESWFCHTNKKTFKYKIPEYLDKIKEGAFEKCDDLKAFFEKIKIYFGNS